MTKIFKGRIVGNNLRFKYDCGQTQEVEASTVQFVGDQTMSGTLSLNNFEIGGFYKIGSQVNVEVTILEIIE